jgi:hypothetical protein
MRIVVHHTLYTVQHTQYSIHYTHCTRTVQHTPCTLYSCTDKAFYILCTLHSIPHTHCTCALTMRSIYHAHCTAYSYTLYSCTDKAAYSICTLYSYTDKSPPSRTQERSGHRVPLPTCHTSESVCPGFELGGGHKHNGSTHVGNEGVRLVFVLCALISSGDAG